MGSARGIDQKRVLKIMLVLYLLQFKRIKESN